MKIKTKQKIKSLDDIPKRMRKDKPYYHCIMCGNIYEDRNEIIIMNYMKFYSLPEEFSDYNISSGLCKKCYETRKEK